MDLIPVLEGIKAKKVKPDDTLTFTELFDLAKKKGTDIAEVLHLKNGNNSAGLRYCFYAERLLSNEETADCRKEKNCVDCILQG